MYNRISNVIGDAKALGNGSNNALHNAENATNGNAAKDKKKQDDEKAVWYEYGCV